MILGTVRNNEPLLLSIDEAVFNNGIVLRDHLSLYHSSGPQDLATIVSAFSSKGVAINSLSANGSWLVIETNQEVAIPITGIDSF